LCLLCVMCRQSLIITLQQDYKHAAHREVRPIFSSGGFAGRRLQY
jgi:hypothetical protein